MDKAITLAVVAARNRWKRANDRRESGLALECGQPRRQIPQWVLTIRRTDRAPWRSTYTAPSEPSRPSRGRESAEGTPPLTALLIASTEIDWSIVALNRPAVAFSSTLRANSFNSSDVYNNHISYIAFLLPPWKLFGLSVTNTALIALFWMNLFAWQNKK